MIIQRLHDVWGSLHMIVVTIGIMRKILFMMSKNP